MDRHELATKINDALPTRQDLTREKVENRSTNIRESNSYILFDIERHPGCGDSQVGQPDKLLQTWRYEQDSGVLERVFEFSRWHVDTLEQNDTGDPVCPHCGTVLDLYEEIHGFVWHCVDCGAAGGKEEEIFDPVHGEPLIERADYEEKEVGLWVPIGSSGN